MNNQNRGRIVYLEEGSCQYNDINNSGFAVSRYLYKWNICSNEALVSYLRREDLSLLLFSYGFNVRNAMHSRKYSDDTSTFFSGQIMCTYIVQMRSSMQQFKHIYKGGSCVVKDEVHKRQDLGFWKSCRGWRNGKVELGFSLVFCQIFGNIGLFDISKYQEHSEGAAKL